MTHRMKFLIQDTEFSADEDESIFEAAGREGVDLGGVCGGRGFCGKCQVTVSGPTSSITETERDILSAGQLKQSTRLACQTRAEGNISVSSAYIANLQAAIMGYEPRVALNPAVKVKKTGGKYSVIYGADSEEKIVDIIEDGKRNRPRVYGLAVDIGTTKIVLYALDLMDGRVLATYMKENPQVVFGADVMSRLARAMKYGVGEQQKMIVNFIDDGIRKMSSDGLDPSSIYDVVVVGNSVMHHLFLGQDIANLSHSPYRVSLKTSKYLDTKDLGFRSNYKLRVYAPSPVEGFIGSDALVGAYVLGLKSKSGVNLFIDLGTNSEIMVACDGSVIATSTPAGSAFEGMNIKHGMKSVPGAIESVAIEPGTLEPVIKTIGGIGPCGITGSGLVDGVNEMLKAGIIGYDGRFRSLEDPHIVVEKDGPEYVLSTDTCKKKRVSISQRDVRELQLAKAAIQAAVYILMKKSRKEMRQISRVYVAGSFGLYINPMSGVNIGLFPEVKPERIKTVGNTAGAGARVLLKNVDARMEVERLARSIESVDLVREKDFNRILINSTHFPSGYTENYRNTFAELSRILGQPKIRLL